MLKDSEKIFQPCKGVDESLEFQTPCLCYWQFFLATNFLTVYQLDTSLRSEIALTRQELKGSECLKSLLTLIQHIQQHRNISSNFLSGNASARTEMQQKQAEIDDDIKVFDTLVTKYGSEFKVQGEWDVIKQGWQRSSRKCCSCLRKKVINDTKK